MAKKDGLNIIEMHVEKVVLGLAGAFLLGLVIYFFGLGPNRIEHRGQRVGPGQIDEVIRQEAGGLQTAINNATHTAEPVPAYASKLEQLFRSGVLGRPISDQPLAPLPERLSIVLPGPTLPQFEDLQEGTKIRLVTPLPPRNVVATTGISLVHRLGIELDPVTGPQVLPAADDGATPLSWVTIAGYWAADVQQREMSAAEYAGHLSRPYVVSIDVQRQELLASGEYGEWEQVQAGRGLPRLKLPEPAYDDATGELLNSQELEQAFEIVKRFQRLLQQTPFFPIEAGDDWGVPPLPGHEVTEESSEDDLPPLPTDPAPQPGPRPPPGGGGFTPPGGGAGPMGPPGGGAGPMGPPGTGGRPPGGGAPGGGPRDNPRQQVLDRMREARQALSRRNFEDAIRLGNEVIANQAATTAQRRQAQRIVRDAQRALDARMQRQQTSSPQYADVGFITNPRSEGEIAVWFHDEAVLPGKTYRYRMRVNLWNRYVGRKESLAEPRQADSVVLTGEWSLPTGPITVAPKQHFFVRGPSFGEPAASIDVFTWHKGTWIRQDFKARVGDVIGGELEVRTGAVDVDGRPVRERVDFNTGAIVLDLRVDEPVLVRRAAGREGEFAYREARSVVVVYLDPADGQVKQRVSDLDRADPLYRRLREEWDDVRAGL